MIHVKPKHKKIIFNILKKYPYTFYAYGSRVKGTHRPLSDLDICFIETIPIATQAYIEEDFVESDLPFQVDVSDFNLMKPDFQNRIKNDLVILQKN